MGNKFETVVCLVESFKRCKKAEEDSLEQSAAMDARYDETSIEYYSAQSKYWLESARSWGEMAEERKRELLEILGES